MLVSAVCKEWQCTAVCIVWFNNSLWYCYQILHWDEYDNWYDIFDNSKDNKMNNESVITLDIFDYFKVDKEYFAIIEYYKVDYD